MGLINDLIKDGVQAGTQALKDRANRNKVVKGTSAHIQPQNDTVSEFQTYALTPLNNGQMTPAAAITKIQQLAQGFTIYAQQLGYARALQGAADVNALAQRLVRDIQAAYQMPGGGVILPPGIVPPGQGIGGISYTTLALVGLAAYFFLRK